jgi:hypothetical protein
VSSNARLALFYDFLFFNSKDSIMSAFTHSICILLSCSRDLVQTDIEPAILVITKSLPKYADMTNSLLEFVFTVSETYVAGPNQQSGSSGQLRTDARRGVQNAFAAVISRGVFHHQQFRETLLTNPLIDAKSRDLILNIVGNFFPDLQSKLPSAPTRSTHPDQKSQLATHTQPLQLDPSPGNLAPNMAKPSSTAPEAKAEEQAKLPLIGSAKLPKPVASVKPVIPSKTIPTGTSTSPAAVDEEDDVLMNWTTAIKSNPLNSSAELVEVTDAIGGGIKRKEPDPSPAAALEPPQKRLKKNLPAPMPSDTTIFKSITEEILLAVAASSATSFSKSVLKLLSSGLFAFSPSDAQSSVVEIRNATAKSLVESMAEELASNDPKQWIFSSEGLPGNKTPATPFLYLIFSFFYHGEDTVVTSASWLVEAMRQIEVSIGWRLLCFCVQRANLVTFTLYNKSKKKEAGDIMNNPALMDKERDWFNAQLKKLQRLDAEDEKATSESMFSPYESLVDLAVPQAERPAALIKDARACAESSISIFLELAPSLLRFLSDWAAEEVEFVKLICFCATPAQLTSICQRVSVGEVRKIFHA